MSIYRRGSIWWARITVRGRGTLRCSTGATDKEQAQEWHDRKKAELWRRAEFGESPVAVYCWESAVIRWLEEKSDKRDIDGDRQRLAALHPHLVGLPLGAVDNDRLDDILKAWPQLKTPGARNRYRATVRAILLRAARRWRWIATAPVILLEREPPGNGRWLTREEAARLVAVSPPHLQPVIRFALATGLRKSNILWLRWDHISVENRQMWVDREDAKGKRPIGLPLNKSALDALAECRGQHPDYVFAYRGEHCRDIDHRTWQAACRRAGLPGLRFHDLRHTAISWLAQAGVDPQRLRAIGGWSTMAMVERYSHLNIENLRGAMDLLPDIKPVGGDVVPWPRDGARSKKSTKSAH